MEPTTIISATLTVIAITVLVVHKIKSDKKTDAVEKEWEETLQEFIKRNGL